jgi:predicted O-methyltransferase YrrM
MEYLFTTDWLSRNKETWSRVLSRFAGVPGVTALEIGVFEGKSTLWLLENIVTGRASSIVCMDKVFRANFLANMAAFRHRIKLIKNYSQVALRDPAFSKPVFDIIYVDGGHRAQDVLEDAILSFRALKKNGIMIFDDYLLKKDRRIDEPKMAIDAFLSIYTDQIKVLHKQYQVIITKTI